MLQLQTVETVIHIPWILLLGSILIDWIAKSCSAKKKFITANVLSILSTVMGLSAGIVKLVTQSPLPMWELIFWIVVMILYVIFLIFFISSLVEAIKIKKMMKDIENIEKKYQEFKKLLYALTEENQEVEEQK